MPLGTSFWMSGSSVVYLQAHDFCISYFRVPGPIWYTSVGVLDTAILAEALLALKPWKGDRSKLRDAHKPFSIS